MPNNIIFMDGAELNSAQLWDAANVNLVAAVAGMGGAYSFQLVSAAGYLDKDFGVDHDELWLAFKIKVVVGGSVDVLVFYDSAGTIILSLTRNASTKYLEARLGNYGATILATGTHALNDDTIYTVEIHYKPLNALGDIEVKVNGASDIDYSGDTTAGLQGIRKFRIGASAISGVTGYVDDIIVDDGDWIGNNVRIAGVIKPSGAGAFAEWDPSAGANYECVDEIPPSDTDYNSTNILNKTDLFSCNDLGIAATIIRAVQINARMGYEGQPTPTHAQLGMKVNGAEHFGSDKSPAISFKQQTQVWMENPETSSPFISSDIDGIEIGYKSTA